MVGGGGGVEGGGGREIKGYTCNAYPDPINLDCLFLRLALHGSFHVKNQNDPSRIQQDHVECGSKNKSAQIARRRSTATCWWNLVSRWRAKVFSVTKVGLDTCIKTSHSSSK